MLSVIGICVLDCVWFTIQVKTAASMSSFFQDGSAEIIEKWKIKLEDAGVPVIIGSNDSSQPRGGMQLNSDFLRVRLLFQASSVFQFEKCRHSHLHCVGKNPTLFSRALHSKAHSNLEFGPFAFGYVEFVYRSRKEELCLTLVLYSAKEFCLIVVYAMSLMLTILLWPSDI